MGGASAPFFMTTANQLIDRALGLLGIKDATTTTQGEDATLGLITLNDIVDSWAVHSLTAYTIQDTVFNLPANTQTRTVGPALQVNVPRPADIEHGAYARSSGLDYPIRKIEYDEFAAISKKDTGGHVPSVVYYDANSPTGLLYFWPLASALTEIHLPLRKQLTAFADLTTDYTLPQGYARGLAYALAVDLAPHYERQPPQSVIRGLTDILRDLASTNFRVPQLMVSDGSSGRLNIIGNTYS